MYCIYFISVALVTVFIYRQGLKDGQKVSNGEKIIDKPLKLFKTKDEKEKAKITEAIKARMEYGNEVKK